MVDSNIWIYYLDKSLLEHKQVSSFMDELIKKRTLVITNFIAVEVIHFLFKRLNKDQAVKKSSVFQQGDLRYVDFNTEDITMHIDLMSKTTGTGLGGRDMSILVCMKKINIHQLVTHDKSFNSLTDITIIDPIV